MEKRFGKGQYARDILQDHLQGRNEGHSQGCACFDEKRQ